MNWNKVLLFFGISVMFAVLLLVIYLGMLFSNHPILAAMAGGIALTASLWRGVINKTKKK